MGLSHDTATRIAIAQEVLARLDLGSTYPNARLIVYSATNVVLAIYAMSVPAFPVPTAVQTAANAIAPTVNLASGIPHHFEITDRNGVARISGDIGITGSGAMLETTEDPGNPGFPPQMNAGEASQITNLVYVAPP